MPLRAPLSSHVYLYSFLLLLVTVVTAYEL